MKKIHASLFYEPEDSQPDLTDLEKEELINSLSDEFIMNSIKEQIVNTEQISSSPTDFLDRFRSRISFLRTKYTHDSDIQDKLKESEERVLFEVWKLIKEKYFLVEFELGNSYKEIYDFYNYFILNAKTNVLSYVTAYINSNLESLVNLFSKDIKDLDYSYYKKFNLSKSQILILNNLQEILGLAYGSEYSANEIISLSMDNVIPTYSMEVIKGIFIETENSVLKYNLSDDFKRVFLSLLDPSSLSYNGIYCTIHEKLFNEYINQVKRRGLK